MSAQQGAASAQVIDDRAAPAAALAGTRVRLGSIDMLHGLVMVLGEVKRRRNDWWLSYLQRALPTEFHARFTPFRTAR